MGIIWMNILLGGGPRQALMALIHPYLLFKGSPVVLHTLSARQAAGCWQPVLSPRCRTAQSSLPALAPPVLPGTSILLTSVNEIVQREGCGGVGHWWHKALPAGDPSAEPCYNPSQLPRGKETSEQLSFYLCRLPHWLAGAPRSSECLRAPNPRQVVLCDQCLARPRGISLQHYTLVAAEASVLALQCATRCCCHTPLSRPPPWAALQPQNQGPNPLRNQKTRISTAP